MKARIYNTTIAFRARIYNETGEASLFIFLTDRRAIGPAPGRAQ